MKETYFFDIPRADSVASSAITSGDVYSSPEADSIFTVKADDGNTYEVVAWGADNQLPYQPAVQTKDDRFLQVMGPNYSIYFPLFMKAIGREDLIEDPVFSNQRAMLDAGRNGELYDIIQEGFRQKTLEEWIPILTELDIPYAICQTYEEVVKDEQAWANDVFYEMDYPRGPKALVRTPITLEETGLPPYEKAPLLGEHTEQILRDLGYSEEEIAKMLEEGIAAKWTE
jgi:cinnamoyl-CoA:phenyllactate CoA-transferase